MDDSQDTELVTEFVSESLQGLQSIEQDLLALESDGGSDRELVNRIFRAIHSMKGAGSYMGLDQLVRVSHLAETLLDHIRSGKREATSDVTDAILAAVDHLVGMLGTSDLGASYDCRESIEKLEKVLSIEGANATQPSRGKSNGFTQEAIDQIRATATGKGFVFRLDVDLEAIRQTIDIQEGLWVGFSSIGKILFTSIPAAEMDRTEKGRCVIVLETVLESEILVDHFNLGPNDLVAIDLQQLEQSESNEPAGKNDSSPHPTAPKTSSPLGTEGQPSVSKSLDIPSGEEKGTSSASAKETPSSKGSHVDPTMRVPVHILHDLLEWTGTMVMARNQLMNEFDFRNSGAFRTLSQAITGVHETVIETRMQTTGSLFERYRRVVRDLSRQLGKEVAFHIEGGELELDRTILESFADPLTHLIRNSLDHALETPAEREAAGKNRQGNVFLRSYIHSGEIILAVEDDGRGISAARICEKAISKGVISSEDAAHLSEHQKVMLIFQPGFSTKDEATDLSGRGVGMDVVKNNIERVGGTIDVQTRVGSGTTFSAILPLAKALVSSSLTKALIVDIQNERFSIPETAVSEIIQYDERTRSNIVYVDGERVYQLRDQLVALVDLRQALGLKETSLTPSQEVEEADGEQTSTAAKGNGDRRSDNACLVILQFRKHLFGAIVDHVLGIQEIVVRGTPALLQDCTAFSGHTVLGTGRVSLILDINGLVNKLALKFVDQRQTNLPRTNGKNEVGPLLKKPTQRMVVFSFSDNEYFAIPLELVAIIERVSIDSLRTVGAKEFCQIKNETLSVLRLDSFLPISPFNATRKDCCLIRPAVVSFPVGILTSPDVAVVDVDDAFESRLDDNKGIVGTFLHNNRLVMLLDIFNVFEKHAPEKLKASEIQTYQAKILVAEDSLFFRKLIAQYIQREEWTVEIVNDGLEAWEKLQAEPTRYNLVISDINMPRLDGFELATKIREDRRFDSLPLVALTTLSDAHFREKGISLGFDRYVIKIDKNQVRSTVAECLQIRRNPKRDGR